MAQSLAREFGPKGIHVCHAIVDGVIDIERTSHIQFGSPDSKLNPDAVSIQVSDTESSLQPALLEVLIYQTRLPKHTGTYIPSQERHSHMRLIYVRT